MQQSVFEHYTSVILELESILKKKKQINFLLFILRFVSFISIPVLLFLYVKFNTEYGYLIGSIAAFIVFIIGVRIDSKNNFQISLLKNKILVNETELQFLEHKFQDRSTGETYSHFNPQLSGDFDIFGEGSLFQYLNRSSTKTGERKLAENLCRSERNAGQIREKQSAIKELSDKHDFRLNFQAYGLLFGETGNEQTSLQTWLEEESPKLKILILLSKIIPVVSFVWIGLVIFSVFTFSSLLWPILLNMSIVFLHMKIINNAHLKLGNTAKTFEKYKDLIKLIENEKFTSPKLKEIQKTLNSQGINASKSLENLNKLLNSFDLRFNILVAFILNSTVIFDIQVYCRLAQWKEKHKTLIPIWFNALSELDSMISFAGFTFNNGEFITFPEITKEGFLIEAQSLGHPILRPDIRICNDVIFKGKPAVMVITGANMAGKSTFLRTISVNLLLAMNGAPVCAKKFVFTPCDIVSSIKIRDSLYKNESYFYAELLRLQEIIKHVENQPQTLVILDEILRGTNTKDKQTGSLGILEKLISKNSIVIIATHDLLIGDLAKKYPEIVVNHCFEVELTNDQLIFDYKLKDGISQKMNASFLMKKLEIID